MSSSSHMRPPPSPPPSPHSLIKEGPLAKFCILDLLAPPAISQQVVERAPVVFCSPFPRSASAARASRTRTTRSSLDRGGAKILL
eukprot:4339564-Pyramimonas_sp.AAC.1